MDDHLRSHGTRLSPWALVLIDETWPPELVALLHRIERKEDAIMSAQDDINAAQAAFQGLLTQANATAADLISVANKLATWIAAQPESVDTSGLAALAGQVTGAAAQLLTAQNGIDALVPTDATVDAPTDTEPTDPATPAPATVPAPASTDAVQAPVTELTGDSAAAS
jgi:hypothetical protein